VDEEQLQPVGIVKLKLVENAPPSLLLVQIEDKDLKVVAVLRQHE